MLIPTLPSRTNGRNHSNNNINKNNKENVPKAALAPTTKAAATTAATSKLPSGGYSASPRQHESSHLSTPHSQRRVLRNTTTPQSSIRLQSRVPRSGGRSDSTTPLGVKSRRVLRYGETMDSLFCLRPSSSSQHRQLCRQIVDGTSMDDPSVWRQVLKAAFEATKSSSSINDQEYDTSRRGGDLLRLHRRATVRFPMDAKTRVDPSNSRDILEIWLSHARVQAKFSSTDEARMTYRHIQNQGSVLYAPFYIAHAEFESRHGSAEKARGILEQGIVENAEPVEALKTALFIFNENDDDETRRTDHQSSSIPPLPPRRERTELPTVRASMGSSPKRRRLEGSPDGAHTAAPSPSASADIAQLAVTQTRKEFNTPLPAFASGGGLKLNSLTKTKPLSSSRKRTSGELSGSRRLNLLSKTSRLGKAKRLDPETTLTDIAIDATSEKHQASPIELPAVLGRVSDKPALEAAEKPKQVKSISKVDLNYMWQWDPSSRLKEKDSKDVSLSTSTASDATGSTRGSSIADSRSSTNNTGVVQKEHTNHSESSNSSVQPRDSETAVELSTGPTRTNHPGVQRPQLTVVPTVTQRANMVSVNGTTWTSPNSTDPPYDGSCATNMSASGGARQQYDTMNSQHRNQQDRNAIDEKYDKDFLPLVNNNNIIPVNGINYVKLGVIGKGGSCKVYRALSKNCEVLAIKKVKLEGMDDKAVEGYANEISLLKSLRGNPSIIQLYDSQVDHTRNSIYLVMEPGEVDLNQVLQQQAIRNNSSHGTGGGSKGRKQRSLNMNFIRLTWQQMLSAVHSIHERRIIHSDLKPANFLFVRGALKLIDFGIAKAIQSDDTQNVYRDAQVGTLNYMSPEAILDTGSDNDGRRHRIGKPSDIWSLGCILYQMVYGRTPFAELHFIQKLQAIVNPNHTIKYPGDVESAAIDAIKCCLHRSAEKRSPIVGQNGLLNRHSFLNSS